MLVGNRKFARSDCGNEFIPRKQGGRVRVGAMPLS
jgi:hypothetical protein